MDLEWRNQRKDIVARVNCKGQRNELKGGGRGWFEVAPYVDWRFDWRLRVEAGITELRLGYGLPGPSPEPVKMRSRAQRFSGAKFVKFIVEDDLVEIVFPLPDCIYSFTKTGWGCAEGGPIILSTGVYHCQARLQAKAPSYRETLRRSTLDKKDGIDFMQSSGVIGRVDDQQHMSAEEIMEALGKFRGEPDHGN